MSVWLHLTSYVNASSAGIGDDAVAGSEVGAAGIDDDGGGTDEGDAEGGAKNWWALLAIALVLATAAGNILVCLAISRERRLQNVTNYFLMSLAITDLMVAVLVMPAGILTLITGFFPLSSAYCLAWICLDVLFCTASIMHLCTISVDRYLSLRYPMRFGRNKTRRRVTLKIVFVWLLSLAMSLPLSLMYSQDHASVLVEGTCQIPDPLYKLVGSIVCFYIPLAVMLLTYALTVRLLALQQTQLGGGGGGGTGSALAPSHASTGSSASAAAWAGSGWLLHSTGLGLERRSTWGRFLPSGRGSAAGHATASGTSSAGPVGGTAASGCSSAVPYVAHGPHSAQGGVPPGNTASSTETDEVTEDDGASSLEARDLWLTDEPTPAAVSALSHFGAEMLKLSRGLETVAAVAAASYRDSKEHGESQIGCRNRISRSTNSSRSASPESLQASEGAPSPPCAARLSPATPPPFDGGAAVRRIPRRASTFHVTRPSNAPTGSASARIARRRRGSSFHEVPLRWSGPAEGNPRDAVDANGTEVNVTPNSRAAARLSQRDGAGISSLRPPETVGARSAGSSEAQSGSTTPSSPLTPRTPRRSVVSFPLPPPCTCPYFGQQAGSPQYVHAAQSKEHQQQRKHQPTPPPSPQDPAKLRHPPPPRSPRTRHGSDTVFESSAETSQRTNNVIVTWDKRGSAARTTLATSAGKSLTPPPRSTPALRRSATQRNYHNGAPGTGGSGGGKAGLDPSFRAGSGAAGDTGSVQSSPCLLVRYGSRSRSGRSTGTVRSHHSRTSSVASRTSSRHGRIIRLEQKATKVLGVVFFTFVVLWAPFFVLNLVPTVCGEECERRIDHRVFDFVTWLGYASSMVNPIFYTIFNKVFRQAFKKVLTCQYRKKVWRPPS